MSYSAPPSKGKVISGGYKVYPSAANGITPPNAASAWANGAYSEVVASTAEAIYITHISVSLDGSGAEAEIDIATGGSGSEIIVGTVTCGIPNVTDIGYVIQLPFVIEVAASTRISVRMRESGTGLTVEQVRLMYVEKDSVAPL